MTKFLSKKQVRERVGVSFAEIARREKAGRFPKRVRDGGRVFWVEAEIEAYLKDLIRKRDETLALSE